MCSSTRDECASKKFEVARDMLPELHQGLDRLKKQLEEEKNSAEVEPTESMDNTTPAMDRLAKNMVLKCFLLFCCLPLKLNEGARICGMQLCVTTFICLGFYILQG